MGCLWGNPAPLAVGAPRPIRDQEPLTRWQTVAVSVLVLVVLGLGVLAVYLAGHRMQSHLEQLCGSGSSVGCALDGVHS